MDNIINVGLTAYGMSGEIFHGPLIYAHPNFNIKKVLERNKNRSAERYPQVEVVKTYEALLTDDDIELIVVNTPDNTHYDIAMQALMAGKHVIVEKPFTLKSSDGEKLIKLAKEKKKMLSIFQNRRWDNDFLTVQKVCDNKLLGRIVEFESHFDRYRNFTRPQSWKESADSGSGTIYNLGSHLIDQALVLFGMPQTVTADIDALRSQAQVDDYYIIQLGYKNNTKVILRSSYLTREPGPRFILHGTEGSFVKYGIDPQEEALKEGFMPDIPNWGREHESMWGTLNTQINDVHFHGKIETMPGDYNMYYQNIYEVIRDKKELIVKPEESLNGIKIIEAAIKSSKEKKTVAV